MICSRWDAASAVVIVIPRIFQHNDNFPGFYSPLGTLFLPFPSVVLPIYPRGVHKPAQCTCISPPIHSSICCLRHPLWYPPPHPPPFRIRLFNSIDDYRFQHSFIWPTIIAPQVTSSFSRRSVSFDHNRGAFDNHCTFTVLLFFNKKMFFFLSICCLLFSLIDQVCRTMNTSLRWGKDC